MGLGKRRNQKVGGAITIKMNNEFQLRQNGEKLSILTVLFQLGFDSTYFMKNTLAEQNQFSSVFSENCLQVCTKTKPVPPFFTFLFTCLPIFTFYSLILFQVAQLGSSLSPQYESFIVPCECSITYPSQLCVLAQMASFELLCEDHLQQTLK